MALGGERGGRRIEFRVGKAISYALQLANLGGGQEGAKMFETQAKTREDQVVSCDNGKLSFGCGAYDQNIAGSKKYRASRRGEFPDSLFGKE
ncbi:hypothetical protein SBV1_3130006 [Verrucomicrobia bacterium]|nr:hypothetical protein SBV1_3130006 [Verrucomicrobiota bacterium]